MPIYLDVSAAVHRRAGLGRYAESLARSLATEVPDDLALFYNREQGIVSLTGLQALRQRTVSLGYKPWRMAVWVGQIMGLLQRTLAGCDPVSRYRASSDALKGIPTVMTVHDLIFRHLPEHHKPLNRWFLNATMPLFCKRADAIIAVSDATRRDLIDAYGLPPEKVTVVYEAAAPHFRPQPLAACERVRQVYGLPEGFLLYVGTIEPTKVSSGCCRPGRRCIKPMRARPWSLWANVGGSPMASSLRWRRVRCERRTPDRVCRGHRSSRDLCRRHGLCLPSLYEGFGLPRWKRWPAAPPSSAPTHPPSLRS